MAQKTEFKRYVGDNTWQRISLWQKNALKLHAHSLGSFIDGTLVIEDPIVKECGYGYTYEMCGDYIFGLSQNQYLYHKPLSTTIVNDYSTTGEYPHIATNKTNTAIGCMCNYNKVFLYQLKDNDDVPTIVPTTLAGNELKFLGCQYVNGLWILLSATHVYYATDLTKGFNSMKYNNGELDTNYQLVKLNPSTVCKYLDYYYVFFISPYGQYIRIKIKDDSLKIVKIDTGTVNDFYGATAIIPVKSIDNIGTTIAVITSVQNQTIEINYGNSPEDLNDFETFDTGIYCKRAGKVTGFLCGDNMLSIIYSADNSTKVQTALIDLANKKKYITSNQYVTYQGGNFYGFDCDTYYAVYYETSGKKITSIFSSSNGIDWYNNWGYVYMENADRTHNIVTSIFDLINNIDHNSASGTYVGTCDTSATTLENIDITLPINFTPKIIMITSTEKIDTQSVISSEVVLFTDRNNETWRFNSILDYATINTYADDTYYFNSINFDTGGYMTYLSGNYNMVPRHTSASVFTWNGKKLHYNYSNDSDKLTIIKKVNNLNNVYNWWAIG